MSDIFRNKNNRFVGIILRWIVPVIAVLIAGRQAYLTSTSSLSTWKGGGMGMFAAADSAAERFARVYIKAPDGSLNAVMRLTPDQQRYAARALWYPTRENFTSLANSVRSTQWASGDEPLKMATYNQDGKQIAATRASMDGLIPFGKRPPGQATTFDVIIEYYSLNYDIERKALSASLQNTYIYKDIE